MANPHIGRKISKIRELRGIKQETLAYELGISQQSVSKIEQSMLVEDATLARIAKVLGVQPEAIKNFNEDAVIYNIQNNYDNASNNTGHNHFCTFNPIDKWAEAMEENKKLYERLLQSEREKVEMLQKLLEEK